MEPKFNIDRPKISDEEINKRKDFTKLVQEFKKSSLKQAQGDESWRKNKRVRYTTVIAGITVICTVTLFSLLKNQKANTHETLTTPVTHSSTASAKKSFVSPPLARLRVPYSTYHVNSVSGGTITHAASKVVVPANSFVTKAGKEVTGEVTIEYREFHEAADIIFSGIPMAYDSAGTKYNLESAGMFDIKGSQNGEPVFIKPDKNLEVVLASQREDNRFNQYYLDTVAGNWQYLKKDKADPIHLKAAHSISAESAKAEKAIAQSPKLMALKNQVEVIIPKRVDSVKVTTTRRIQQLPQPSEPFRPATPTKGRQSFKLDGSYKEFPELAAFNNVLFEVGPENTTSKDLYEVTWSDIKISQGPVKGKNYLLLLSYRNRAEKLIVYPVLSGDDLEKAQKTYEEHLATYENLVDKRRADEKRLMDEMQAKQQAYLADLKKKQEQYDQEKAALFAKYNVEAQSDLANNFKTLSTAVKANRLFRISQFGVFNSDCPHTVPSGQTRLAQFSVGGKPVSADFIYLVDHNTRCVYQVEVAYQGQFKLSYVPENTYSICVFSKNQLFLCDKNNFKEAITKGDLLFPVTAIEAQDFVDFKKALEI